MVHPGIFTHLYRFFSHHSIQQRFQNIALVVGVGVHVMVGILCLKSLIVFDRSFIIYGFDVDCVLSILILLVIRGDESRKHFHMFLILWIVHAYYTMLLLFFFLQYSVNNDYAIIQALFWNIFWNILFVSISITNVINELRRHCNDQGGQIMPPSLTIAHVV